MEPVPDGMRRGTAADDGLTRHSLAKDVTCYARKPLGCAGDPVTPPRLR